MNAYHANRIATDPAFHQRAKEYQRLWRIRQKAFRETSAALAVHDTP